MRRIFWIVFGATVGILVVRAMRRTAGRWTPEGLVERAGGFWSQVSAAAAEREVELRSGLGLDGSNDEIDAATLRENG